MKKNDKKRPRKSARNNGKRQAGVSKDEAAVSQSENRFKALFEKSADAQLIMDHNHKVVDCNAAFLDLFCIKNKAEVLGHSPDDFAPEYQPDGTPSREMGNMIMKSVMEKGSARFEWLHRKHDDAQTPIFTELVCTVITIKGSQMIHVAIRDITERKRIDEIHHQNEEKYRNILETMEEAYFEVDLKGNLIFFNAAVIRRLGYTNEETMGMNFRKFMDKENKEKVFKAFNQVFLTGESNKGFDWEIINKQGEKIAIESSIILRKDEKGEPVGFRGIVRDITKRREAEEALRQGEKRYRTVLDIMNEGYFENDLKGNFIFENDAAHRLMGYEHNELIGSNYRKIHTPGVARFLKEVYTRIYQTGKPEFLTEYNVVRKDGSIRTHQLNAALIKDPSGQPVGFCNLVRDVTDRKVTEEALRISEEKYRTILETMEEGLIESDLKGNCIYVNDAACKLHGYNRDEMIGMSYKKRSNPEMRHLLYEVFHRIYETGKPEFLLDHAVICKDGSIRILQSNIALMRDVSGKPIGFRALIRDVTDRKKVEEEKAKIETQLFQAQKMESVGSLAGGVAHDFNNMLTVILGYTELIKSRLPQDDSLFKDILEIEKAAGRSKNLTRQLLAYSRKEIIAPRLIDLNDLIVGAENTLSRLIGEDIDLRFYQGIDIWKIKFDPSQMELILINLASNARDAMPNGGKLTIEISNIHLNEEYCRLHLGSLPGDYVLLGVSDDGIGMDKETMQHVFEPFFTTKETGKGTGLGLATVDGIVKQNGGFINVYSEPGKGTTLKIYIPRSLEEGVVKKEPEEALIASGTGTVLIVEDDDMVRKITTQMLELIGYTALSVGTPMEALSFFKNHDAHIDLVITDVVMPQINGRELSDRIKAIRPGVKMLFSSGYSANVIAHQGILEEGVHFIQKPFSLNDLARKVHDSINDR
jgi:PAS domain S-box-containing protein